MNDRPDDKNWWEYTGSEWEYVGSFSYETGASGVRRLNEVVECPDCYALIRREKSLQHEVFAHPTMDD